MEIGCTVTVQWIPSDRLAKRVIMRNVLKAVAVSAAHWIVTLVCAIGELRTSGLIFFKSAEQSHPVWSISLRILETPFLTLYRAIDPQKLRYYLPVMILNSVFWGFLLISAVMLIKKRRLKIRTAAGSMGV
jgi:hypothetical protein